ncbi:protein NYNRIN-like [Telopea speciosissima]|uniref:protein NYNRIN-like n=1 Tax=Telopea speciosissima TaxID=54955 RepID=UPI001CC7A9E3|nr:protein NYNRIN-like [Telopea speciosissima]
MEEIPQGICGPHMNTIILAKKIVRLGYYWATLEADCTTFVKRCHNYQIFANIVHVLPIELHSLRAPWPFSTWGIDIIGKVNPKASNGHKFILVAINYFTKWVKAQSYTVLTVAKVEKFIKENIICRYRVPLDIISDQSTHFWAKADEICTKFSIKRHRSTIYMPQTNAAMEADNKNMKVILQKWQILTRIRLTSFHMHYGLIEHEFTPQLGKLWTL